jgi:uncharacterized membrane protein YphA (DoxX/SURF4 family)
VAAVRYKGAAQQNLPVVLLVTNNNNPGEDAEMNIALWITAILLTVAYLAAGAAKTFTPKGKLQANMAWVEDVSAGQVTVIGVLELLGALGVILPLATGIAPVVTAIAAVGLVLVQVAALVVHARRNEPKSYPVNVVLLLLALAVVILRLATL